MEEDVGSLGARDMKDKLCIVTGANSGIGRAAALGLAKLGARVVLVCRDSGRGEEARQHIIGQSGNESVDLLVGDLSSQRSTRELAAEIQGRYQRLDVLVNNAGRLISHRSVTEDGLETTFALNHLGYFLLTNLLVDLLKVSAHSRVVNVASSAHRMGTIDFDDLQYEEGYGGYKAYSRSKLANVLFTYELARRLEGTGVTVNCMHPGTVRTNLFKGATGPIAFCLNMLKPLMRSLSSGAETVVYLASSPDLEGITGRYFFNKKACRSSRISYDAAMAQRLWQVSSQFTDVTTESPSP